MKKIQKIESFITEVMNIHGLVGIAAGVVKDGKTVLEAGFGKINLTKNDPVTNSSVFHLASISKLFTASAIMQLIENGLVNLDDSPQMYLPCLKMHNTFTNHVCIRHLLSHSSGISDVIDYGWDRPEYDDGALERYIQSLDLELLFNPGTRFSYSNIAYEILGAIIAVVSGMPFETYIKNNLLDLLQMENCSFHVNEIPDLNKTCPHSKDLETRVSEIYPYNRAHAPSSTLQANIGAMNLWAIANLNKEKIFKQESSFEKMTVPCEQVVDPNRKTKHVGLGWFLDERRGISYQYHSGHDVGFTTYHLIVPQESLAITVLCNTAPAPIEAIAFGVLDIVVFDDNPEMMRPHIVKTIGPVFLAQGAEAMKTRYYEMRENQSEMYDFGVGGFLDAANSLLDLNRNELALKFLQTVLEIDNANAKVFETLARAYFQHGDYENAIKSAQLSLQIDPDNPFLKQQLNALN